MASSFIPEQETNRLLRQSWEMPGGTNMLAREISSLFDVFFKTQTIGTNFARLDTAQTFLQPQTFATPIIVGFTGGSNAVDITHTGAAGFSLSVYGRPAIFYHGIALGQANSGMNSGNSLKISHVPNTTALAVDHQGGSGFSIVTAGKPNWFTDGLILGQTTAGTYSLQIDHAVSGTAAVINHVLGGLALFIIGGLSVTGNITVTGNISCTGSMTASSYIDT